MKISKMVVHYAFLFTVPPFVVYMMLRDHKKENAQLLDHRPDVQRAKKQQADIVHLILDNNNNKQKDKVVDELLKKGS
jgi:hypothetical protein